MPADPKHSRHDQGCNGRRAGHPRTYRRLAQLALACSPEILQRVLSDIRALLAKRGKVVKDGQRVRFVRIGVDALEVEIFANIDTTAWPEYLELAEELNVRLLKIIAAAGASLALPAQSLVVERADAGLMAARPQRWCSAAGVALQGSISR